MAKIPNGVPFNQSTAADHTVQAAVAGHYIVVKGYALQAAGSQSISFKSDSTTIWGPMPAGTNGGAVLPVCENGWFATAVGEALKCTLSAAQQTGGGVTIEIVKGHS